MILIVILSLLVTISNLSIIYYYSKLVRSFIVLAAHAYVPQKSVLMHPYFTNKIIVSLVPILNIIGLCQNIMEFHIANHAELIADRIYIEKFR